MIELYSYTKNKLNIQNNIINRLVLFQKIQSILCNYVF